MPRWSACLPGSPVMTEMKATHVAAAAVFDAHGRVLIAQRPAHVHQGGLWEFPGGKLEPGESPGQALERELLEELGIHVVSARQLIQVRHDYPDKSVLLDVWRVEDYTGIPVGREGQPLEWVALHDLGKFAFPIANIPIIQALLLPDRYLITPEPDSNLSGFLEVLERAIGRGISLVQLRARQLAEENYRQLALAVAQLCRPANVRLLLNCAPHLVPELGAQGVHLTGRLLMELEQRPLGSGYLVAASCHNREEVIHAGKLGVDFVVVSPVRETASHPGMPAIGMGGLRSLCEFAAMPAYALGGMQESDIESVWQCGAQGIAAIRGLWV
jgi:8-oxo-dGTP diphosphatase